MVKIQGYEDIVLEKLLRKYDENDILIQRTEMPELWYIDDNGKYHRYFPDFYIPSKNLVIEVKSIYTYKQDTITYHKKRKACLYAGFCFENYMYKSRIHDRVHMHI
jgi:predicted AAA+ superfamily ATPase